MTNILRTLLEITIGSSFLIVIVMLIRKVAGRKISPWIMMMLWLMVIVRLFMPLSADVMSVPMDIAPAIRTMETTLHDTDTILQPNVDQTEYVGDPVDPMPENEVQPTIQNAAPSVPKQVMSLRQLYQVYIRPNIGTMVLMVWIGGILWILGNHLRRIRRFRRTISGLEVDQSLQSIVNDYKADMNISHPVTIGYNAFVDRPITFGLFRHIILLPHCMRNHAEPDMLKLIILHEMHHIQHLDTWKNVAWMIVQSVYWFNPLIKLAYQRFSEDMERLCDERVIRSCTEDVRYAYSRCLVDVVKQSYQMKHIPAAASFAISRKSIGQRVRMIMEPKKRLKWVGVLSAFLAVVVLIVSFATGCGLRNTLTMDALKQSLTDQEPIVFTVDHESGVTIDADVQVYMPAMDTVNVYSLDIVDFQADQFHTLVDHILGSEDASTRQDIVSTPKADDGYERMTLDAQIGGEDVVFQLKNTASNVHELSFGYRDVIFPSDGWSTYRFFNKETINPTKPESVRSDYYDALTIANELVQALNEDKRLTLSEAFSVQGGDWEKTGYSFIYQRTYNKTIFNIAVDTITLEVDEMGNMHVDPCGEEIFQVVVREGEIVFFWWAQSQPEDGFTIIEDDIQLMDFDQIRHIFEQQCREGSGSQFFEPFIESVHIERVELLYIRLRDPNHNQTIARPVWVFIGDAVYKTSEYQIDDEAILMIDAIDGSNRMIMPEPVNEE